MNAYEKRWRAADRASVHFTRAAAALTERPVTAGAVAFALLEASMGLLCVAECDVDFDGQQRALDHLRGRRREATRRDRGEGSS